MVQSLEASESKSNGCHFYSFLNGFTNIGHVKSICKIAPILRLIDFLTIDVSSENLVCGTIWFFWGIVRYETILSDADWIINTSSSKSAQFILYFFDFVLFYWIWLCVGKITTFFCKRRRQALFSNHSRYILESFKNSNNFVDCTL